MSCETRYEWPCTYQGTEKYFGINLAPFLAQEAETLTGVDWIVPNGLELLDERIEDDVAYIKLLCTYAGDYNIPFTVYSTEGGNTQATKERINLHVIE